MLCIQWDLLLAEVCPAHRVTFVTSFFKEMWFTECLCMQTIQSVSWCMPLYNKILQLAMCLMAQIPLKRNQVFLPWRPPVMSVDQAKLWLVSFPDPWCGLGMRLSFCQSVTYVGMLLIPLSQWCCLSNKLCSFLISEVSLFQGENNKYLCNKVGTQSSVLINQVSKTHTIAVLISGLFLRGVPLYIPPWVVLHTVGPVLIARI